MIRKLTCIECPKGCVLSVEVEGARFLSLSGNDCPKGEVYAKQEIETPMRILTSTVVAVGLPLKMIPVRTDRPIPKGKIFEAMQELRKLKLSQPVSVGEVIVENFLGLGVNLISTRESLIM
jgi:CxxC motif-containing protein